MPLISKQVKALSEQIRLSREADENAARRTREWETLKACEKYHFDPILEAVTLRIWKASNKGEKYSHENIDKRDAVCVLNYLDGLSTGVDQGLYIEAVIKDHMSVVFKHAVESFIITGIVTTEGYERTLALHQRWWGPAPPGYRADAHQA